jgi:cytochrome c biogenesis protein CcdA/thiol-disulfide isomerase/thioredoxin
VIDGPGLLGVAFIAGVLTILGPCSLPILPLVLGATGSGRAARVAAVLAGFAGTFLLTTVVIAAALAALGVTTQPLRLLAAAVFAVAGAVLAWPRAADWLGRRAPRPAARASSMGPRGDIAAGLAFGAGIGLLWAPCAGPLMAPVIAAAVVGGPSASGLALAAAYVAGAAVPLAAIALGGRSLAMRMDGAIRGLRLRRAYGVLMVAAALVLATGLDVRLQAALAAAPATGTTGAAGTSTVGGDATPDPTLPVVPLEDLGTAPEFEGITGWINSKPLTMASLHGKVVLVHFWTFACINCIHAQPYVKAWYDRYAADGFVVVGVHTPELSFERELANVRQAVADDGVTFPVAFDPSYATWNAYGNKAWPGFWFVDRQGTIRHVQYGEGDYDRSEAVIRELLAGG